MDSLPSANLVWLIPGLPLLGFLFHAFFGKMVSKRVVGTLATGVVLASFAVSVKVFLDVIGLASPGHRAFASLLPGGGAPLPWIEIRNIHVYYGAIVDPLSVLMCLIVTGVGGLIHLYATGYMADDSDYPRFFTYFNLFIFFMLTLVLADNILLMFVGWEGVGLCSYLLISFWYEDPENVRCGNKAFLVNRVGDAGFTLGMLAIFATFGTFSFYGQPGNGSGFLDMAAHGVTAHGYLTIATATLIGALLFLGACGKSAQFPLHIWLPDAMAGPTPVSALIHAATMVTAGVVMVARVSPIIIHSPAVMSVIAIVGCFTAFFAATIALTQNDIKKVLAYSTVSQLGYMFLGCGVGAFTAGMFHVTTHAFFKGLLFLGAGSAIHAIGGNQDMRRMGGLWRKLPITGWTMVAGWLALAGLFPFAGFWSKDEILGAAAGNRFGGMFFYVVGIVTAALTAFYMSRLMWKTFFTQQRFDESEVGHGEGHGGVHESPKSMLIPLVILAVLSTIGGFIGLPWANRFEEYLAPAVATPAIHHGIPVMGGLLVGTLVAALGILLGWYLYGRRRETGELMPVAIKEKSCLYQMSQNLWFVNSALMRVFVTWAGVFATAVWQGIDRLVIDGIVNGVASLTSFFSEAFRRLQTGYIRAYTMTMLIGVVCVLLSLLISVGRAQVGTAPQTHSTPAVRTAE